MYDTKIGAYTLVLALDPETLQQRTPLFNGIMYSRGGLSRAETEMGPETPLRSARLHVGENLRLIRPLARPVGLLLEREAVEERGRVAGCARVVVVAPGAADPVRLLQDREGVDAGFLQSDREAQAGKAGADDGDPQRGGSRLPAQSRNFCGPFAWRRMMSKPAGSTTMP